jgi:hypothetical protein
MFLHILSKVHVFCDFFGHLGIVMKSLLNHYINMKHTRVRICKLNLVIATKDPSYPVSVEITEFSQRTCLYWQCNKKYIYLI